MIELRVVPSSSLIILCQFDDGDHLRGNKHAKFTKDELFFFLTRKDDRYDCNATMPFLHLSCTFVTNNNSRSFDNNFVCTSIALVCTSFSHSSSRNKTT